MASSSTSSIQKCFKYDVFLSFRGEDTRKTFIDHLHRALEQKNIVAFKDDERINKGKRISNELIRSIEESRFYIIVFSKNYASSSWCLDELVKIMECQKMAEHTAYPIFYDVEPTEIRKQIGSVGEAFAKHENGEAAGKWSDAMKEAANLAGWDLKNTFNGHEAKLMEAIVEKISVELSCINLNVDESLVGMEDRVKVVVSFLQIGIDDVRMIGIKGIGGGGKTTLARAVFDRISILFEGSSFVENVREVSNNPLCGLKSLQKQVLSDVSNDEKISVSGVFDGKNKMKRMMRSRTVLVVLDDVDHMDQLGGLAGEHNWFKPGSRIIITTTDEQVLLSHGVNIIHDVNLLSDNEALCLFSRYAFRKDIPIQGYEDLSQKVVRYAAGLPLTIKVLGSFLYGKRKGVWADALERLKTIPSRETLKVLELSYIGLENDYKEIFLDIACILKGWLKNKALRALESRGFHAKTGLKVLEQKSLITISEHGYLGMHDRIEEMGMNIVRCLHPGEPWKHSRLWMKEEIEYILSRDLGTEATRCIKLVDWQLHPDTVMKGLKKMKKLGLLHLGWYSGKQWKSCESIQYLPNGLKYLHWWDYPFTCLPKAFHADNLVELDMNFSNISQLWEGGERKVLNKIRFVDLSSCKLRTLDLKLIPNLQMLTLEYCEDLVELDMSFRCEKLKSLDLSYSRLRDFDLRCTPNLEKLHLKQCKSLVKLHMPGEMPKLKSLNLSNSKLSALKIGPTPNLEILNLEKCESLVELQLLGERPELKSLDLSYSKLRALYLGPTPNLEKLHLKDCKSLVKLHMPSEMPKLKSLNLYNSKLSALILGPTSNLETLDVERSVDLVELRMPNGSVKLKSFKLYHSKLRILDISQTLSLMTLDLQYCEHLEELHPPVELTTMCLVGLPKLRTLDLARTPNLEALRLKYCDDLVELHMHDPCVKLKNLHLEGLKLRTLDLGLTPNLEELYLEQCYNLVELHAPVGCLRNHETFSGNIGDLRYLRKLTLKDSITKVPKDLHQLECLEELSLSCTEIKHLSNNICLLKHLKVLKLESCWLLEQLPDDRGRLECFPDSICMLKHQKEVKLESCWPFEQLPEDLSRLECLEELILSSTRIRHLPNSICMLKHLKVLKLQSCWLLEQLPADLGRLECLVELILSSTKIKNLPNSISMLKHLRVLKVESCWLLEQLPEDLGRLECLVELNLRECIFLRGIPNSICEMKCLKYFRIPYCILVEKLPEEIGRLKCLEYLDIEGTVISHLPQSIIRLKNLSISGSRLQLESYGLTSVYEFSTYEAICYIQL